MALFDSRSSTGCFVYVTPYRRRRVQKIDSKMRRSYASGQKSSIIYTTSWRALLFFYDTHYPFFLYISMHLLRCFLICFYFFSYNFHLLSLSKSTPPLSTKTNHFLLLFYSYSHLVLHYFFFQSSLVLSSFFSKRKHCAGLTPVRAVFNFFKSKEKYFLFFQQNFSRAFLLRRLHCVIRPFRPGLSDRRWLACVVQMELEKCQKLKLKKHK